jgi:hypothetical protein
MNNPLIDKRALKTGPWHEEMIWIQRNELGHIVGISEKLPATNHFVPTGSRLVKKKAHQ